MDQETKLREAFEAWFETDSLPLEHSNWFARDSEGYYDLDIVENAWEAWQAGINLWLDQ